MSAELLSRALNQKIATALGLDDHEAQDDVAHFMSQAARDMQTIMDIYDNDIELMHSSAILAAAHAAHAAGYKTKLNERIAAVLEKPGRQGHDIRQSVYQAIESSYYKNFS